MCKRCPFTSSATDSFIIIIYASGLLNYGCCFGVLLGDGKILVTPGRVFYGLDENMYEIKSTLLAETTWNRYAVETQYKWDRYNLIVTKAYQQYSVTATEDVETGLEKIVARLNELPAQGGSASFSTIMASTGRYDEAPSRQGNHYVAPETEADRSSVIIYHSGSAQILVDYEFNSNKDLEYYDYTNARIGHEHTGGQYVYTVTRIKKYSLILERSSSSSLVFSNDLSQGYNSNKTVYYQRSQAQDKKERGSRNGEVTSNTASTYPENGSSGNYWYISAGSEQIQGAFIDTITSYNGDEYPSNGVHTDGYWYVKI